MKTKLFLALILSIGVANSACKDYITNDWEDSRYTNNNNGTITDNTTT